MFAFHLFLTQTLGGVFVVTVIIFSLSIFLWCSIWHQYRPILPVVIVQYYTFIVQNLYPTIIIVKPLRLHCYTVLCVSANSNYWCQQSVLHHQFLDYMLSVFLLYLVQGKYQCFAIALYKGFWYKLEILQYFTKKLQSEYKKKLNDWECKNLVW